MDVSGVSSSSILNTLMDNPTGGTSADPTQSGSGSTTQLSPDSYIPGTPSQWQAQAMANTYSNTGLLFSSNPASSVPMSLTPAPTAPQAAQDTFAGGQTQWQSQAAASAASNTSILFSADPLSALQPSFDANSQLSLLGQYEDFKLQTPELLQRYVDSLSQAQASGTAAQPEAQTGSTLDQYT